jgi:hypothetical protein
MKLSLTKNIIGAEFIQDGLVSSNQGEYFKCFKTYPLSSGLLEENFDGNNSEQYFKQ